MPHVRWSANPRGEYWIDVYLGGRPLQVLIDSGLIDGRGQVGFSIDEALYDNIKQAGGFANHQMHARLYFARPRMRHRCAVGICAVARVPDRPRFLVVMPPNSC